jgi:hypothetical protein
MRLPSFSLGAGNVRALRGNPANWSQAGVRPAKQNCADGNCGTQLTNCMGNCTMGDTACQNCCHNKYQYCITTPNCWWPAQPNCN